MIEASSGTANGVLVVVLSLSQHSYESLLDGDPIVVHIKDVDPRLQPLRVIVMGGDTKDSIEAELGQRAT